MFKNENILDQFFSFDTATLTVNEWVVSTLWKPKYLMKRLSVDSYHSAFS